MKFDALAPEYARLWSSMVPDAGLGALAPRIAEEIATHRTIYQDVERQTGVPWWFVGLVHEMESGGDFGTHLHNGDPLSGKTRRVPAGRPLYGKGPYTWQESAIDALTLKGLDKVTDWSLERVAYELERFNGFGYRRVVPPLPSPYLWSGSGHYTAGKYVADGKFDRAAVSKQVGGLVVLRALMASDTSIAPAVTAIAPAQVPPDRDRDRPVPADPRPVARTLVQSTTIRGAITAAIGTIAAVIETAVSWTRDVAAWIGDLLAAIGPAGKVMQADVLLAAPYAPYALIGAGLVYVASRRIVAAQEGKIG